MKNIIQIIVALICYLTSIGKVCGHGGEDHSEKQKANVTASYFSSENSSEKYEVLVKYGTMVPGKESDLTLFLSDVNTNVPIGDATIKITNVDDAAQTFDMHTKESGIYEIHTIFSVGKAHKLNISIDSKYGADLIQVADIETGKELPTTDIENGKQQSFGITNIVFILMALVLGLLIGLFTKRNTKIGKSGISVFLLLLFILSPQSNLILLAHSGEDHDENKKSTGNGMSQFLVAKETQFLLDVETIKTNKAPFAPSIILSGTILPSSSGKAVVQAPQTGVIKSLNVSVGQKVSKNQLLAAIEQNVDANTQVSWITQKNTLLAELSAAKKEYDRLLTIADIVAKRDIEEAERRYNTALQNKQAFDKLLSSGKSNSKFILLYSPIAGKVENFNFAIGATISVGQELLSIVNLQVVYVEAQVFSNNIGNVKAGKEFALEVSGSHKGSALKLVTMSPGINSSNQSTRVLFELDNSDENYKIGEFVNIHVYREKIQKDIVVPSSAITEVNGKLAVFVKSTAEAYTLRYIQIGENDGTGATIVNGLEVENKIVFKGTYQLKMMYLNQ